MTDIVLLPDFHMYKDVVKTYNIGNKQYMLLTSNANCKRIKNLDRNKEVFFLIHETEVSEVFDTVGPI